MRQWKTKFVVALVVLCACVAAYRGISNWMYSSNFGRLVIKLENGKRIYAVRESRGLNGEILSFTENPDGCMPANPATDYIEDRPTDNTILYAITPRGFTLYDDPFQKFIAEPQQPWTDTIVFMNRSKTPYYGDVRANPSAYGAVLRKVPLNEYCLRNLFRRSNGFPAY
jgi:hypothetical protein